MKSKNRGGRTTDEFEALSDPNGALHGRLRRSQSRDSNACDPGPGLHAARSVGHPARLQGDDLQRPVGELWCAQPRDPEADDCRHHQIRGRRHRRPTGTGVIPPHRYRNRTAGPVRRLRWSKRQERRADSAAQGRLHGRWRGHGHPEHGVWRFVGCHLPGSAEPPWGECRPVQYPPVLQQSGSARHPTGRHAGQQVSWSPGDHDGGSQRETGERHDELPPRPGDAVGSHQSGAAL